MLVGLDDLEDGMVLAKDVRNMHGQVLLRGGTVLQAGKRRVLRTWGVKAVAIADPDQQERSAKERLQRAEIEAAAVFVRRRFRLCDLGKAHVHAMFAQAVKRQALAHRQGEHPSALSSSQLPAIHEGPPGAPPSLDQVLAATGGLHSLPDSYQRVTAVVDHAAASAHDIAQTISQDQAMAARVLRLANSSLYAFPGHVDSVSRAVTIIGTRQIRDLALATAVMQLFAGVESELVSMPAFWLRSFACACFARQLAVQRREPNPERH
ncbi:MAG: HDOD domain-containing protein, partial [Planctomycetota bacterium]